MHEGEFPFDEALVTRLLAAQFSEWAGLPVRTWPSTGTVSWDGEPRWIHGDLMRPNLLVVGGRLSAGIDFGGVGVCDPAMDLVAAWSVFGAAGRAVFRQAPRNEPLLDAGAWARARGYALHQAALIAPYYADSHPAFAAEAVRIVGQVLGDGG